MAEVVHIRGTSATAKVRHPLAAFGLVFLTLGIYYLVWYYKVNRELRDLGRATGEEARLGRKPFNSLLAITVGWLILVPPFVSFYRTMQRIEAAQEICETRERASVALGFVLYLLALFTFPVEVIYAQNELNRIWRSEAARALPPIASPAV
jgi:Ca2+/Na+ antiporter